MENFGRSRKVKTRGNLVTWGIAAIAGLGMMSTSARADALPATILNSNGVLLNTSVAVSSAPQNPTYPVSFSFGDGGGFAAAVDGHNTTVWCVDSEEDIWFPTNYQGDLVSTAHLTSNLTDVKYGNVTGTGSTGNVWALDLGAANNNATARFQMAAYLVSKYESFPNGPVNDANDRNLQVAIWEITYNYSVSSSLSFAQIQGAAPDPTAAANYISQAETFVDNSANASYFNNFAILSGNVNSSGAMSGTGYQTYVVQLNTVPEPASWMALFAGLGLLALAKLRLGRRLAPQASSAE